MLIRVLTCVLICLPLGALADDKLVRLHVPQALAETGVLSYILPRFSLKTQVRVEKVADPAEADLLLGDTGRSLFEGAGQVWKLEVVNPDHPGTGKLAKWLRSEVGQRAVTGYAPDGQPLFTLAEPGEAEAVAVTISGDAELGHDLARAKCVRCHAVDEATRGWGIGSTPSFGVLRTMSDWEARFAAFYQLKPHAAFTQITGVTDPFPPDLPSPIAPIELSLDELEAMLAYVAVMPPADLGKPLEHQ
ncbi:hypothetical protein [Roseovarius sp. 2305UL8-3]|uniref:hypothetical protein n=1 Tax=Roseovarius conchicola TaxID=3121636 RepID=UPI0035295129